MNQNTEKNLENELKIVFRHLHENPELSNEEIETTKFLRKLLEDRDIKILDLPLKTGLVAEIKGSEEGSVVAIRCDIDGLPIDEETNLAYKSKIKGKMHGCGHDFYSVSILGATYLLKEREKFLKGTVRILFQPAEETSHGAESVINTGALSDVDVIFGLHNSSELNVGEIGIKEGALTAAVDRFEIKIKGVGVHAASPHKGNDPIIVAANLVNTIQSVVSRNIDPFDEALISVTHLEAGNTWNVIPTFAYMEGTVRTLNANTREFIKNRLNEITTGTANTFGMEIEFLWHEGPPETNNDREWTGFSRELGSEMGYKINNVKATLGGEDFAYYEEKIKGSFVWIGTGKSYAHHNPKFEIDESAIIGSAKYFALIAEKALDKLEKNKVNLTK